MEKIKDAATEFLANRRIAVTGVSRNPRDHGSNVVYRRLRERGYEVFAVNPNADEVEGDVCHHDLKSIPGGVDAVVIATNHSHVDYEALVKRATLVVDTRNATKDLRRDYRDKIVSL